MVLDLALGVRVSVRVRVRARVKFPIYFLTLSCDPISSYGKPVERTNEIISRPTSLIRSTGFPQQLT